MSRSLKDKAMFNEDVIKIENLEIRKDKYASNGLEVTVINPFTKQGVGIYLRYVSPEALRKLADLIDSYNPVN